MPRGHQKGAPCEGRYGRGVKTKVMRVPVGTEEYVKFCLNDLPDFLRKWDEKSKNTRDWTQLRRMVKELQETLPSLPDF